GVALSALGTADHLGAVDHQVAWREVVETEETRERIPADRNRRTGVDAELGQGRGDDLVHREPQVGLPPLLRGHGETVGQLAVVDEGTAATGTGAQAK